MGASLFSWTPRNPFGQLLRLTGSSTSIWSIYLHGRRLFGLIEGAAAILPPASPLYLYGPYIRQGFATAPSNQAFDRSLRDRNPAWVLRDLHDGCRDGTIPSGFSAPVITEMSANNLRVVFRRMSLRRHAKYRSGGRDGVSRRDCFSRSSSLSSPRLAGSRGKGRRWFRACLLEPLKMGRSVAPSARRTTRKHALGFSWCLKSSGDANNKGLHRKRKAG